MMQQENLLFSNLKNIDGIVKKKSLKAHKGKYFKEIYVHDIGIQTDSTIFLQAEKYPHKFNLNLIEKQCLNELQALDLIDSLQQHEILKDKSCENLPFPIFFEKSLNLLILGPKEELVSKFSSFFAESSFALDYNDPQEPQKKVTIITSRHSILLSIIGHSFPDENGLTKIIENIQERFQLDMQNQFTAFFEEQYINTDICSRIHYCFYIIELSEPLEKTILAEISILAASVYIIPLFYSSGALEGETLYSKANAIYEELIQSGATIFQVPLSPVIVFQDENAQFVIYNEETFAENIVEKIIGKENILHYKDIFYEKYRKENIYKYSVKLLPSAKKELKEKMEQLRRDALTCLEAAAAVPLIREELEEAERTFASLSRSSFGSLEEDADMWSSASNPSLKSLKL